MLSPRLQAPLGFAPIQQPERPPQIVVQITNEYPMGASVKNSKEGDVRMVL